VRGVAWSTGGGVLSQVLQFAVGIVLARLLGPEAFGLIGMAMVVTGIAQLVGEAGLGPVIVQRREVSPSLLSTVFWFGLGLGLVEFVLLWFAAPSVAALLRQSAVVGVLRGCSVVLLVSPIGLVQRWLLTRDLGFRALARIEVLSTATGAAAAISLSLLGAGVEALVTRMVVTAVAAAVLAWGAHPWRPLLRWDGPGLRTLLPYSGGVIGTELLNQVSQNVDFFLIGRYLGAATLGQYSLAYSLATLPQGRLAPLLARVMFPVFARVQGDDPALRRGYLQFLGAMALVSFPLMTVLGVLGPPFLPAVYGARWRGAAAVLPALCAAGAFYAVATTVGSLYRAKGRPDLELKTTAVRAVLLVICITAGLVGWGTAQAVALAVAFYAVSSTLAFQPVANSLIGLRMRDYLGALAPAALGCGLMAAAIIGVRGAAQGLLANGVVATIALVCGVFTYVGVIMAWRGIRGAVPSLEPPRSR
jgi:O-antigen/teichoic acid export membrane protein